MRCAVFSCMGLGDGLLAMVLAHNLRLEGHTVTLFHPFLAGLQTWFPDVAIRPFPEESPPDFDRVFIFFEKSAWMERMIAGYGASAHILNPIATKNRDYPHWAEGQFDGRLTLVENLFRYCRDVLQLRQPVRTNGIKNPFSRRFPKRVIIHPTSSRPGKNWPKQNYLTLASQLKKRGYDPVFIVAPEEVSDWPEAPRFSALSDLAAFVAESGSMIGNDSGIGHLASALGLPTLTIGRSRDSLQFWRPDWSPGIILTPPSWIPNIKGLRLRDRYWKPLIPVSKVLRTFLKKQP
jgi:heptosyltransferase-3